MFPETVIVTETSEPEVEPTQTDTPEAVADAAVEIAQIEANRDVRLAEIDAETRENIEEHHADALTSAIEHDERIVECLTRLDTVATQTVALTEQVSSIAAQMALIQAQLTPAEPNQPNQPEPEGGEVTPAYPGETVAEIVEAVEPEPPAEPERKRPASRWI